MPSLLVMAGWMRSGWISLAPLKNLYLDFSDRKLRGIPFRVGINSFHSSLLLRSR